MLLTGDRSKSKAFRQRTLCQSWMNPRPPQRSVGVTEPLQSLGVRWSRIAKGESVLKICMAMDLRQTVRPCQNHWTTADPRVMAQYCWRRETFKYAWLWNSSKQTERPEGRTTVHRSMGLWTNWTARSLAGFHRHSCSSCVSLISLSCLRWITTAVHWNFLSDFADFLRVMTGFEGSRD